MASRTQGVQPATVHVSDALQDRLDTYCAQDDGRTATSVVFAALEHFRAQLPELLRTARARPASPWANQDVHYLGSGRVHIRVRPDEAQATLLDQVTAELGVPLTVWLPPVLNAYLPGCKEPDNMPWLVLER